MLKVSLVLLLSVHGLIHALGFVKAFDLAPIDALKGAISPGLGIVWLVAGILFLVAAVLRVVDAGGWWMIAAPALVASQVLVFASWSDAKVGSVANLLILVAALVAFGGWRFDRGASARLAELNAAAGDDAPAAAPLTELPPALRRWIERSEAAGRALPRVVHLEQRGRMRTSVDGRWMPFVAEQWFTPWRPGFEWVVEVEAAPGIVLRGRDDLAEGRGSMRIELLGLVPVVDARGSDIDLGAAIRFFGEIAWFPDAAALPYVRWLPSDDLTRAEGEITLPSSASGPSGARFTFDEAGDLRSIEAMRYLNGKLTPWRVEVLEVARLEPAGIRAPRRVDVIWDVDGVEWRWLELEVVRLDDDATPPGRFPRSRA